MRRRILIKNRNDINRIKYMCYSDNIKFIETSVGLVFIGDTPQVSSFDMWMVLIYGNDYKYPK